MKIGFVGLGIMGSGMAQNLLKNGFEVFVYNRTSQKAESLVQDGAVFCSALSELAQKVDAILICVTNDNAVEEILFGDNGLLKTDFRFKTVIDFSTISPKKALEFGTRLRDFGVLFIDAPVSGGDVGAREGTLTVMVGGDKTELENLSPIFEAVGKNVFYTGALSKGQLTKAVNQWVVSITVAAMTEGIVKAREFGLDLETTLEILQSGAAGSWSLDNYAPRVIKGDLKPGFFAKDMLKDLKICQDELAERNIALPIGEHVAELYERLCKETTGLGNHALIKVYD